MKKKKQSDAIDLDLIEELVEYIGEDLREKKPEVSCALCHVNEILEELKKKEKK